MATFTKRGSRWRVQVRRDGHTLSKSFRLKSDAEAWARDAERDIDRDIDPNAPKVSQTDTFAALVDLHIEDMLSVGKPLRRSKEAVLARKSSAPLGGSTARTLSFSRPQVLSYCRGGSMPQTSMAR